MPISRPPADPGAASLFDDATAQAQRAIAPLAVRMRPRTLDEVVGQSQLKAPGTPLRRMVENPDAGGSSLFLWGPPGSG
ncbi:MAG: putative ATPase [Actinomycetota bacterium]|nr:putative ATPase [Actinomycetota bacterium]